MANWTNEAEAREQIKTLVAEYYHDFKEPMESKENFKPGDRVSYASRVYDEKEMQSLTDAMLDFWLTTGRFSKEFEKNFAEWIGVKFAHLVNSGSSANLRYASHRCQMFRQMHVGQVSYSYHLRHGM